MTKKILLALAALALIACGRDGLSGERPADAGTGGLSRTGGTASTGGAGTGGSTGTGGATGGAVPSTGGALGTGGAGTGGAEVADCPDLIRTSRCGSVKPNERIRSRYADGLECVTCKDSSAKPVVGCFSLQEDLKSTLSTPVYEVVRCVDSCESCPIERCFSNGGDSWTEYPCS